MLFIAILFISLSDFEGSDDNCLIPNETRSFSKSISRILNFLMKIFFYI